MIGAVRAARPDIALSCTSSPSFPGETEADFDATLQLIEEVGYASAFSFKYSRRPGTPAAAMAGQVAEEVKDERLARLQALLGARGNALNGSLVGRTVPVLFEALRCHPANPGTVSRPAGGLHVDGPEHLIGRIAPVTIAKAAMMSLTGDLALEPA